MTELKQKTLGEQIRQYRGEHDLTQVEFAEKCGISFQTVIKIEKENRRPRAGTEVKILKVIGKE